MPTFSLKSFNTYFKRILQTDQATNIGITATTRKIQTGDGANTSISLSDDVLSIQPVNDDSVGTLKCLTQGGASVLTVDTVRSKVLLGASQVPPTLTKEMGLYDFSPTAGYHNPLIAHNMMLSDSGVDIIEDQSMFGNDVDPAIALDLSADGTATTAVACYWYLDYDITIDSIRYALTTDGLDNINFHLESYTVDTSSAYGDLSAGATHASAESISSSSTIYKTGLLSLNTPDIDANKVLIGFVESDSTTDISCTLTINYHIR